MKDDTIYLLAEVPLPESSFLKRVLSQYDKSFIANLAFLYINGGFKVLYDVALKEMFKTVYKLSPNEL